MSNHESAVSAITNRPEKIPAFGKKYEIKRFVFGQFCDALEYTPPLVPLIMQLSEVPRNAKGEPDFTSQAGMRLMMTALQVSGPSVIGLVSIATQEPREWLEQQDPLEGLGIFIKVVEKNLDFLSQANVEKLTAMLGGLQQQTQTAGGESSTNSSTVDTPTSQ